MCFVHLIIFFIITKICIKTASDARTLSWLRKRECFTESDEVYAAFGKWPCFVILHTLYKYLRAHYLLYKWMCGTWDTWWSHQRSVDQSNFMSMPFAKYARMTIVSDSAIAEGLFVLRAQIISFIFIAHYSFMVRVHSRT